MTDAGGRARASRRGASGRDGGSAGVTASGHGTTGGGGATSAGGAVAGSGAGQDPGQGDAPGDVREITDYRAMRALAHPVRLALLDAIRREGTLTASAAAELLDDSPGNMSWHLQTLAKYGFIEEAGGGRGRSRPWRAVAAALRFSSEPGTDPEAEDASNALASAGLHRAVGRLQEWWTGRAGFSAAWREAAFVTVSLTYLTPAELDAVESGIHALLRPYWGRLGDPGARPDGALPVEIASFGHPMRPTPSGN